MSNVAIWVVAVPIIVAVVYWSFRKGSRPKRKRAAALRKVADEIGFTYVEHADPFNAEPFLDQKMWKASMELRDTFYGSPHHLRGQCGAGPVTLFDIHFGRVGSGRPEPSKPWKRTQAGFRFDDLDFPVMRITPEGKADRFSEKTIGVLNTTWRDLDFDDQPAFSDRYLLMGSDHDATRALFTQQFIDFWMSLPEESRLAANAAGTSLLVFRDPPWRAGREGALAPRDYAAFIAEAERVAVAFRDAMSRAQAR